MSTDFILPDIGEGIVECELVEWHIKEGDLIAEDQVVADVSTDKALVEITSMHTGRVSKLYYVQGEIAKVHTPLFSIDVDIDKTSEEFSAMNSSSSDTKHELAEHIIDFILPDIGEGIVECEVVEWQVKEGDYIKEDQPVADVSTDKALVEITSMYTGKVVKLYYAQGEVAKVHSPMFAIAVDSPKISTRLQTNHANGTAATNTNTDSSTDGNDSAAKVLTTPAVRRIARENNLDLTVVASTGKNGRVLKEDALNFLKNRTAVVNIPAGSTSASVSSPQEANKPSGLSPPLIAHSQLTQDRVEPIKGVRAVMARAMMESVSTIPHFTYVDEVDMGNLIALREGIKDQYAEQGIRLTMMPFFMKALSLAIMQYPIVNSRANADFSQLHYLTSHNIGLAVDAPAGLMVPNVKEVQHLSIPDIAIQINKLIEAARSGRISPDALKGGTITISNVGAIGGTAATPIINQPEVAIVALGKVQILPRFDANGNVVAKNIMTVSWSGDHRVIDGATIARFNNVWKGYLENPTSMLMTMS